QGASRLPIRIAQESGHGGIRRQAVETGYREPRRVLRSAAGCPLNPALIGSRRGQKRRLGRLFSLCPRQSFYPSGSTTGRRGRRGEYLVPEFAQVGDDAFPAV